MNTFICWKWESTRYRHKFTADHVNIWADSLRRNFKGAHRMVCITDDPRGVEIETYPLWDDLKDRTNPSGEHLPSCYRRLKLFSSQVQHEMGIKRDSHVAWIDLDVVFVRDVTPMFAKYANSQAPFFGWMGTGAHNPVVYNGTLVMFRAGAVDHLWNEFDFVHSPKDAARARYFGSDQGWISYKIAGSAPGWGTTDGILSYSRDVRPAVFRDVPRYARIVSFNGKAKPWDPAVQIKSPWIARHWRRGP